MLSITPQESHYSHLASPQDQQVYYALPTRPLPPLRHHSAEAPYMSISTSSASSASASSSLASSIVNSMGGSPPGHQPLPSGHANGAGAAQDAAIAQALEIARESPDGAQDPTVSKILEQALTQVWSKVVAQPDAYIMTRDEFAVFNFFQHRFVDDKRAVGARKRYWDNSRA